MHGTIIVLTDEPLDKVEMSEMDQIYDNYDLHNEGIDYISRMDEITTNQEINFFVKWIMKKFPNVINYNSTKKILSFKSKCDIPAGSMGELTKFDYPIYYKEQEDFDGDGEFLELPDFICGIINHRQEPQHIYINNAFDFHL